MAVKGRRRVKEFFQALFEGTTGYIEIRTIRDSKKVKQYFYPCTEIDHLVTHLTNDNQPYFEDANVYFGVCSRKKKQGKEKDVGEIKCLWVDLDCKTKKGRKEVLKKVKEFELSPSIIVSSGHGLHCYWLLNRPYPINNNKDKVNAKGYLKGLALVLGGDNTFDLSRILRVPGTKNVKDPDKPLPVEILEFNPTRRYKLDEFRGFKVEIEDVVTTIDISLDEIPDRFWRILEENKKLKATWKGRRNDFKDTSRSAYDMSLANLLMPYNFSDSEIAAILKTSESGKGKDAKPQYLILTIAKARKQWERRKNKGKKSIKAKEDSSGNKPKTKLKEGTRTLIPNLIYLVKEDNTVKYLLKEENRLHIQEKFISDGVVYKPKQDLPIKILGPDILEEPMNMDWSELLDEVIIFIKSYLEIPSESNYLILALWIFHTYLIGKFNTTPILYFYGVKETGKSRAGEILGELAFMCERLTSPTEATLFREADYFKTSLIIDEIKLWGQKGNQEVARLIKSRYKRGLKVPRVNLNRKGENQIEYFDVFGPLAICTTESIPDAIESRCITFLMQKNMRVEVEKLIDEEWATKLRHKLTIFRVNYLDKNIATTEQVARRRLNEIMMPLYQILMLIAPKRKDEFKAAIREMEKTKEEEEGLSLEAEIVERILEYKREAKENVFLTTEIVGRLNRERSEREKLSDKFVSFRIKRLGFQKTRLANGKRGFRIKSGLIEKLALQFGIDFDIYKNSMTDMTDMTLIGEEEFHK